jgi:hypothetical protein
MADKLSRHPLTLFHGILALALLGAAVFVGLVKTQPARSLRQRQERWHHVIGPGDLLFQDIDCGLRCDLIRVMTHSPYVHVGLVLADAQGQPVVWEAFNPVGPTPLMDFIQRGRDHLLGVYRLEPALLDHLPQIAAATQAMAGRPYDSDYQWDDERLYCSELIEKAVQQATGVELAPPRPLGPGAFGEYRDTIKAMSKGRLTEQTPITSPVDLTRSPHLQRIADEVEGSWIADAGPL